MFGLTVRDHMMIAHSFNGEIFGPAQKVHGATYVVDVTFERHQLDKDDLVVDIGLAAELLESILSEFNMQNLDELPELRGASFAVLRGGKETPFLRLAIMRPPSDAIHNLELQVKQRVQESLGLPTQVEWVDALPARWKGRTVIDEKEWVHRG